MFEAYRRPRPLERRSSLDRRPTGAGAAAGSPQRCSGDRPWPALGDAIRRRGDAGISRVVTLDSGWGPALAHHVGRLGQDKIWTVSKRLAQLWWGLRSTRRRLSPRCLLRGPLHHDQQSQLQQRGELLVLDQGRPRPAASSARVCRPAASVVSFPLFPSCLSALAALCRHPPATGPPAPQFCGAPGDRVPPFRTAVARATSPQDRRLPSPANVIGQKKEPVACLLSAAVAPLARAAKTAGHFSSDA